MKKSELKQLIKEAVQEVLNEDSDSQSVSGFINVYALVPDRFKEVIDKGNNYVKVILKNGKVYNGVRYNAELIAVSNMVGEKAINTDGRKLMDNEKELEFSYEGDVYYNYETWKERHPYGMGYAYEPMSEYEVDHAEVDITDEFESGITPQAIEFINDLVNTDAEERFELR